MWRKLLCLSDFFTVESDTPIAQLCDRLKHVVLPKQIFRTGLKAGYEGRVSETGFRIRRLSQGLLDTKAAIAVSGRCFLENSHTVVRVDLRYGWLIRIFHWISLLLLVAVPLSVFTDPTFHGLTIGSRILTVVMAFLIFGAVPFGNCRDLTRVRREVTKLLIGNPARRETRATKTLPERRTADA